MHQKNLLIKHNVLLCAVVLPACRILAVNIKLAFVHFLRNAIPFAWIARVTASLISKFSPERSRTRTYAIRCSGATGSKIIAVDVLPTLQDFFFIIVCVELHPDIKKNKRNNTYT